MCASLGPTTLGLSEVPGLPGSLLPLPDWGSFPSLFVQISFQYLTLPVLLPTPHDSDVGTFKVVLEVPKPLIFFSSCFFILFWLDIYFFLLFQIVDFEFWFLLFPSRGLLVPCIVSFISLCIAFISWFILQPNSINSVSILITSVLNLYLIGCLSHRRGFCIIQVFPQQIAIKNKGGK